MPKDLKHSMPGTYGKRFKVDACQISKQNLIEFEPLHIVYFNVQWFKVDFNVNYIVYYILYNLQRIFL